MHIFLVKRQGNTMLSKLQGEEWLTDLKWFAGYRRRRQNSL